jgi:hypothetical protein
MASGQSKIAKRDKGGFNMADKVFKVNEVVTITGSVYTMGQRPAHFGEGEDVVDSITCNREHNAFNKGLQVPGASYTIVLTNGERRLVPFHAVADVGGKWIKTKGNSAAAEVAVPDLPEA